MLQPIKDEELISISPDRVPVKTYYLVGKGRGILFWKTPEVKIEERENRNVTSTTEMLIFSLLFTLSTIGLACSLLSEYHHYNQHIHTLKDEYSSKHAEIIRQHPECDTQFGDDLPIVPLISFPGSGNTWLRNLVEITSGIYTGSVYNDNRLYTGGFKGERLSPLSGKTIVVKSHLGNGIHTDEEWLPASEMFETKPEKCILLIRNPIDAFFSVRAFQKTKNHTGLLDYPDFHSMVERDEWKQRALTWSRNYVKTYTSLVQFCENPKYVFYDEVKENPFKVAKKLVQFIERVPGELIQPRKNCVKILGEGDYHRQHQPTEHPHTFPIDLFSKDEKQKLDRLLSNFNSTISGILPTSYSFYA